MRFLIGCLFVAMAADLDPDDLDRRRERHAQAVAIVQSLSPATSDQEVTDLPEELLLVLSATLADESAG